MFDVIDDMMTAGGVDALDPTPQWGVGGVGASFAVVTPDVELFIRMKVKTTSIIIGT